MSGYLSNLLPTIQEDFDRQIRKAKYADDPVLWMSHMFGIKLNEKQVEIAEDLAHGHVVRCAFVEPTATLDWVGELEIAPAR